MALLNSLYVFVQDESVKYNITTMTHPVEDGIELTDHVRREAQVISLTGKIVGENASSNLSKIVQWQAKGTLIAYVGRNYASNYQITNFNTSHPNTNTGGCDFTIELKEVRIANSTVVSKGQAAPNVTPTKAVTKTGMQQQESLSTSKSIYHIVKKGETLYSIANRYYSQGATVANLIENNDVVGGALVIGQRLIVGNR